MNITRGKLPAHLICRWYSIKKLSCGTNAYKIVCNRIRTGMHTFPIKRRRKLWTHRWKLEFAGPELEYTVYISNWYHQRLNIRGHFGSCSRYEAFTKLYACKAELTDLFLIAISLLNCVANLLPLSTRMISTRMKSYFHWLHGHYLISIHK